ncbi:helix-turn-helix domain-containing protein [Alterisphingorhabdus coralli]|uniref:Helix-turn-helix transcriptional regulator n=1 Tax=Alterisphingorhabdus coralli TaxID=3071408 RepID=A0AA97F5G2_9SPHN|nr:helix-turn-helix transcriptional regulator [Parasphingorhabdus sp. SCSIO 66989]WOE74699.1 helix-turn-helix transcriptional regulator [Parasphingorhabdus sp. SCSIO 66989]
MSASAWVKVALERLNCSQKELAMRLGVSPSQITKWKADEYMSLEMEMKFEELTGITDQFPDFVLLAGSKTSSEKWARLILFLADFAAEQAETGYDTWPLQEEPKLLCWNTFHTLSQMGVSIPGKFPEELVRILDEDCNDGDFETSIENFFASIILKIFKSLNDVYAFYAAYVAELTDDDEVLETGLEIEACLMSLAATKIEVSTDAAPKFRNFTRDVRKDYERWLRQVQEAALSSGKPIRAEIMDLIDEDHGSLGFDAEAESLGVNKNRLHPDIYMNELLVGMRAIHQVLPAIIKKLDISEHELAFDRTQLVRGH